MPLLCEFYGIVIAMYFSDHLPPHFHARYGSAEATFGIRTRDVLQGWLPPRAVRLVQDWAALHQAELLRDWAFARASLPLDPIPPLD